MRCLESGTVRFGERVREKERERDVWRGVGLRYLESEDSDVWRVRLRRSEFD